MAVIFISPKQRQKLLIQGIIALFLLFVICNFLIVLLSKPKKVSSELVFTKPKITIDIKVFDSELFKDLKPLPQMGLYFQYEAHDKKGKLVKGTISASSIQEAEKLLKEMGLEISLLKEAEIGRENPFSPYY